MTISTRLDTVDKGQRLRFNIFFFFFFKTCTTSPVQEEKSILFTFLVGPVNPCKKRKAFFFYFSSGSREPAQEEKSIFFYFSSGSRVLFTGPTSTLLKKNFKIGSYRTIHTFKNYFTTVFSIISKINGIQTDLEINVFITNIM